MYKRIEQTLPIPISGKILGISGIENFYPFIDKKNGTITETFFPPVDMMKLPFNSEAFDYVISDQVIEHLENPLQAISESYRILKKGGVAIHTSCLINQFHPAPKDFWRFSPEALKSLCKNFSEIIQCEAWGNRLAVILCMMGDRLRNMKIPERKLSLRRLLATRNQIRYPIHTWIIAKK